MRLRLAVFLVFLPAVAPAETHYVKQGGDDRGPGTMQEPWATLQKAADVVASGDVVIVLPGSYGGFDLRRGGATFRAQGSVNIVDDNRSTDDGINIEGAQGAPGGGVVVEGFTVNGRTRAGIRVVWCEHCTI